MTPERNHPMKRFLAALCALTLVTPAFADPIAMPVIKKSSTIVNADGVVLFYTAPTTWADGSVATDLSTNSMSAAEVQVDSISGGDSIAFTRSLTGGTYYAFTAIYDQNGNAVTSITAPGIYSLRGGGLLKYTKTGSASTPVVTIRAAQ